MSLSNLAWVTVIPMLGFLVIVHELGHYWVGRKMGIKVEEFGIGFPPRAKVLFVRKGVPFTLNWLPLGGFVRFAGEESGFDDPDSLMSAPPRRRIPVLAAGVIANILVAILLFTIIFTVWGSPVGVAVASPDAYAAGIGFQADDELVSINGIPISTPDQLIDTVNQNQMQANTLVVRRASAEVTLNAAPLFVEKDQVYRYGITLRNILEPENVFSAFWNAIKTSFGMMYSMLTGLVLLVAGLFKVAEAPAGGVTGVVGIARITGEVTRQGLLPFLQLTAVLSLNLALINLLPIPALDGSRIVFALIEAVRRKKIPPEREAFVHAIGMMVLLGLMVVVTLSDVGNLISNKPAIDIPTPTVPASTP